MGGDGRGTRRQAADRTATGRCWSPTATTGTRAGPNRRSPGADEFTGEQIHVHHYREPDILVGKRVLVLGIGNSAVDIAVESSRIAEATFLAMRRGAYVLPKFLGGKPIDEVSPAWTTHLPLSLRRVVMGRMLNMAVGEVTDYGLPKPDHKLLEAHPTVSSELLPRLGHGDIAVRPNIDRFAGGRTVRFVDGTEEEIDLVVYCTGYRITFPFLSPEVFEAKDNRMPLYRQGRLGRAAPASTSSASSSRWDRSCRSPRPSPNGSPTCSPGRASLPSDAEMRAEISDHEQRMRKRFVASKRHTIEVDFHPYLRQIRRERKRAAQAV